MRNRKAKIAAAATVLGLGGLGGIAMGTNHGVPAGAELASRGGSSVVTGASGGASTVFPPAAVGGETARAPIVTRVSGGPSGLTPEDD